MTFSIKVLLKHETKIHEKSCKQSLKDYLCIFKTVWLHWTDLKLWI